MSVCHSCKVNTLLLMLHGNFILNLTIMIRNLFFKEQQTKVTHLYDKEARLQKASEVFGLSVNQIRW